MNLWVIFYLLKNIMPAQENEINTLSLHACLYLLFVVVASVLFYYLIMVV